MSHYLHHEVPHFVHESLSKSISFESVNSLDRAKCSKKFLQFLFVFLRKVATKTSLAVFIGSTVVRY